MDKRNIEVVFTPALYQHKLTEENYIVVIVDILRATTAITSAFNYGVDAIIPVAGVEDAKKYKQKGYLIAAERDGIVLDFADFGNSPFNFMRDEVKGQTIAYSTTNGTKAIEMVKENKTVIGAFSNLTSLGKWLLGQKENIVILCAGWKQKFNLEDSIFAGALADYLNKKGEFDLNCDSAKAAIDLWGVAKMDLINYIEKCSHRSRLKSLMLDDVVEYCFTLDTTNAIPILKEDRLVNIMT